MTGLYIPVRRLPHSLGLDLPTYATVGSAGMDLIAAVTGPVELYPGERKLIPTGLCVAVPQGFEMQVRPRSGLALKYGITVLNAPGTIDSDYRGEIGVILLNTDHWKPFTVDRGMRIAQAVFAAVVGGKLIEVEDLDATTRGAGGFGSTGLAVRDG